MSGLPRRTPERATQRWNRVFEALSAEPRRQLVATLSEESPGGSVVLPDAAITPDGQPESAQLRLELRHQYLPLLAAAEYVEWQRTPFRAAPGSRFEEITVVLETLRRNASEIPDAMHADWLPLDSEHE